MEGNLATLHAEALAAAARLAVAGMAVPSPNWFLYGFVRKEAVISCQIEGIHATLEDPLVARSARCAPGPGHLAGGKLGAAVLCANID